MKYRYFPSLILAVLFCMVFSISFTVKADSQKTELHTIENFQYRCKGYVICQGDKEEFDQTADNLNFLYSRMAAFGDDMYTRIPIVSESFDISQVDINTPGSYNIRITMKLEDEFTDEYYLSDKIRAINIPIFISKKSGLEMFFTWDKTSSYQFEWYAPDKFLPTEIQYLETDIAVKYTEEDLASADWQICNTPSFARTALTGLIVYKPLPEDKAYYFRVKVGDDFTNTIRLASSEIPSAPEPGGISGNRDGDDSEEPGLPPLTQTSPGSPEQSDGASSGSGLSGGSGGRNPGNTQNDLDVTGPASSSSGSSSDSSGDIPEEIVTDTKTAMSGARIRMLLATEEKYVTYAWDGICLRIPEEFFDTLNLADDDLFAVEMKRLGSGSFRLSLTLEGRELTEFAPSSVQISMADSELPYTLYLNGNKLDTEVTYEEGCATFQVTHTGTYELRVEGLKETAMTEQKDSGSHTLLLTAAVILIVICMAGIIIYFIVRRRRIIRP